jgi:hypothetical protein
MQLNRFTQIVEAYGSQPQHWPQAERQAASLFAEQQPEAQRLLARHDDLDRRLNAATVAPLNGLEARIFARVIGSSTTQSDVQTTKNNGLLSHFLNWLMTPQTLPSLLWRPGLVAAIPLLIGLFIGSNLNISALDESDSWDEQVYLLALTADTLETYP